MYRRTTLVSLAGVAAVALGASAAHRTIRGAQTVGGAKPRLVTVTTREFTFDAPASIPAGVTTLRLVNAGKEPHHLWISRIDSGKTMADVEKAMKSQAPPPAWIVDVGGPNAVDPGGEARATLDLAPGTYIFLCAVPSADGVPHIAKGMVKPLTVTPLAAKPELDAVMPKGDVEITLDDYGFLLDKPLAAGRHTLHVTNRAGQSHEVAFVKLAPGKTAMDFVEWIEKMAGPPPGALVGGLTGIARGQEAQATVDLTPGEYALLCFVPDATDGKPHFVHGMMRQVSVQ